MESSASESKLFQTPAAQAHYKNADVTLACEQCCVTNCYFQRLVTGCKRFFLKERKNVMVLDKID